MATSAVTVPQAASLSARAAVRGARAARKTVAARRVSTTVRAAIVDPPKQSIKDVQRPDASGRYGAYGGKYVPETLIPALQELEKEYAALATDEAFQVRISPPSRASRTSERPQHHLPPVDSARRRAPRGSARAPRRHRSSLSRSSPSANR